MIVEIRKAGFANKGAELMLRAILARMRSVYPQARFVMVPTPAKGPQPFERLVREGMFPKASLFRYGVQWGDIAGLIPRKLREMYGVVLDREVDVVLDASGFSYGDQFGDRDTRELARATRRWKRAGAKVILMPQAFGPFTGRRIRRNIAEAVSHADLVIAREEVSYGHLVGVVGERDNLRIFPDVTIQLEGTVPSSFESASRRVAIVPNTQMLRRAEPSVASRYIPFLRQCVRCLKQHDVEPFVLIHESSKDLDLAKRILAEDGDTPILKLDDALEIKGVLGACHATIGSRFHGLVSALSQGVPSLAAGWSHKYDELFKDFGFPDGIVRVDEPIHVIQAKIDQLVQPDRNRELRERLLSRSAVLKQRVKAMWQEVFATIDGA
jgi:polysaccharide pyruvyl transferase WcaK-like protein